MTEIHTIQNGETLSGIADHFGVTLDQILALNIQIDNPDIIFAGQQINVPEVEASGNGVADGTSASSGNAPWLSIAEEELGTREIRGHDHNPRIVEYHHTTTLKASDDETPWCSSFVNWCFDQAGMAGTDSAAARSWRRWGRKLDRPRKGCVVVFSSSRGPTSGHVGYFEREQRNHILVLGGNQQNAVNYSSYPKSRLLEYRWPT